MRFESKIDIWLIVVMITAFAISVLATLPAIYNGMWWAIIPLAVFAGFVLWIFRGTFYLVQGKEVLVRSGPFKWRIPADEIENIEPTRNPLSSPALSLDRLRIRYSGGRSLMISPKDREGFLAAVERASG
jgi:hypothetical protein